MNEGKIDLRTLRQRYSKLAIVRSVRILSRADKRKVVAITVLQVLMSLFDLLGVLVIGLLGVIAIDRTDLGKSDNTIKIFFDFLGLSGEPIEIQVAYLGGLAIVLLVGRTVFSIFFTRRILFFFSRKGAAFSANLVSQLLSEPLLRVQSRTTQETLYLVTRGVEYIALNVLATTVVLVADISLLVVMGIGLFLVDPATALGTGTVFALIGLFLYRLMHTRAGILGSQAARLTIESNEKIVEVFSSYRESIVRNRRQYYSREIEKQRHLLADKMAEVYFMPFISKYVVESSVVVGAVLLSAIQLLSKDISHAVSTLSIFLAAGTRIAPAVLRIQQGSIQIRSGIGMAEATLELIEELGMSPVPDAGEDSLDTVHDGFVAEVEIVDVSLVYPGKTRPAIAGLSLSIPVGTSVAIVGPSGAGKTTLIDVLLGVLSPESGYVKISRLAPLDAISRWPGAISYVPQDVAVSNGSIRENIGLGYPSEFATDELVMNAIRVACLEDFINAQPAGMDTLVGERGSNLSGGQRQRLGIARAVFTKPALLVLDEATSALDGETEANISEAILNLRGSTTVVMIAHRLSTVRDADMVVYMAEGSIVSTGTFEEVRRSVPDFDRQARLMGL